MRWERLFADLSAELDADLDAEIESEIADRTRAARAQLRIVDRLRGAADLPLEVRVLGVGTVAGVLRGVGPDWCLLRGAGGDHVVRLGAVMEIGGLAAYSSAPGSAGVIAEKFSLGAVVRRLARDRAVVTVTRIDGSAVTGMVELAGADLFELSDRRLDEPDWTVRARSARRRAIPLDAVAVLRH